MTRARAFVLIALVGTVTGVASQATWLSGCAVAERGGAAGKVAAIDCGKTYASAVAGTLARWGINSALVGKVDWAALETDALGLAEGAGACAYGEFLRAWKAKPQPAARMLVAGPEPADEAQAGLERLRARIGGAPIRLADGTVI